MRGILVRHKETAEGDHRLYTGKHLDCQITSLHANIISYNLSLKPLFEEITNFLWRRWFEDVLSSHRWALRRSVPSSSPERQLQRHKCRSCSTTLTITWEGQGVTRCVSCIMFTGPLLISFTTTCRYKEEISRLCRQQGTQEPGRSQSAYSSLH